MLTPAELDEIERHAREAAKVAGPSLPEDDLPALVLGLVATARKVPRWIPTDERLPEDGARVLVWPDEADARATFASRQRRFEGTLTWVTDDGKWFVPDPAFWMPVPEPPE